MMAVISRFDKRVYNLELEKLAKIIKASKHLVVFTGAGISTASGLSDYRGKDGVWTRKRKGLSEKNYKPFSKVKPTKAHEVIYKLFKEGIVKFVISQNIDNLHRRSGISESHLAEIHGNYNIMRCSHCDKRFFLKDLSITNTIQTVSNPVILPNDKKFNCSCNGAIIPTFVNFGSPILQTELNNAYTNAQRSDVFIAIGTTMSVEPASIIPKKALHKGAKLVIINLGSTEYDRKAYLKIEGDINEILPDLYKHIKKVK